MFILDTESLLKFVAKTKLALWSSGTMCFSLPISWASWLLCLALICSWNLCWEEQRWSRYWQTLLLSVWKACFIPSDVFCNVIFFFYNINQGC